MNRLAGKLAETRVIHLMEIKVGMADQSWADQGSAKRPVLKG
jgi:hypothetical protein